MKELKMLGLKVMDRVTGFEGVVASICFDLYGCVQAYLTPAAKEGKLGDGGWFDLKRLEVLCSRPVLDVPTFEVVPGPQAKSAPRGM